MRYAQIIQDSWELTTDNPKLKWLVFVPSFVAVIVFVAEVSWQLYLYLGEFKIIDSHFTIESIRTIVNFLAQNHLLGWFIFVLIFILFFAFVVPSWVLGALILGIKQKIIFPQKYCSIKQKLVSAYDYFFQLFEFHAISGLFSLWSIALFTATFYRYFHDSLFKLLWPFLVIYTIFAFFISVFLSFTPYFIVCEKEPLTSAIKKSIGLVFLNFGRTISIMLLMLLVNFRVLLNMIIVLLVPIGIFAAFTYFTNSLILGFSVIIGIGLLAITAYLTAILEVFSTTVWIESFFQMRSAQKALLEVEDSEKV